MRRDNSTYGSVSLTLGSIWIFTYLIVFFIFRFLMGGFYFYIMLGMSGYVFIFVVTLLTVIYGIIGMIKDRKLPMAIIGLNLGITIFIILLLYFFLRPYFLYPYGPLL